MTEHVPTTQLGPSPDPRSDAQLAELGDLAARYPEPDDEKVAADVDWLNAELNAGRLNDVTDDYVGVMGGRVVGTHPDDDMALRIDLARRYSTHPTRFVIVRLGEYARPVYEDE